jgi:hypothetical protein
MYTFSPLDRLADSELSSQDMNSMRRTLVEKSDQRELVESQVRSQARSPRRATPTSRSPRSPKSALY